MTGSGAERRFSFPVVRSVDADDGVPLLYRAWEVDEPRGCVRIVHGLGEHGRRYGHLADALHRRGVSVYAADLRGHGVSGGRRGHVRRFDDFLSDFERVREATPIAAPVVLLGHSLGGLIALRAVQTGRAGPVDALVLSAPALDLEDVPWWRDPAAAVLSRVLPGIHLPNGIDPADLSHDSQAVAAYEQDALVHDRITPRLYREMRRAMREAAAEADRVTLPVLLLAPGADRVTRVAAALAVAERFGGDVRVRHLPGYFHEPLHERDAAGVVAETVAWIERWLS